jgi:Common central domain of tyrosinase
MVPGTHNNGYFLPFHRYLAWNWESALIEECGLKLTGMPYWDWSLDTPERNGSFATSPVFDNVLGFGGDGKTYPPNEGGPRCVETGPFAKYPIYLTYRNMVDADEHCLERDFQLSLAEKSSSWTRVLRPALEQDNYEDFSELDFAPGPSTREKGGPHTIGHMGIGGEVRRMLLLAHI